MSRVALATCAELPHLDEDSALLVPALARLGVGAEPAVWDDPGVDWSSYDLVAVRSCWDYTLRRAEFLAWARSVPRLVNPAPVLTWNTDKTYLRDLQAAGVPVVPTVFVEPGRSYDGPGGPLVVKPTVSAGARDTERCDDAGAVAALVGRLHAQGRTAMVQPYVDAVDEHGETSVLVFGGVVSHGARKAALLTPGVGRTMDDDDLMAPREPSEAELAVVRAALAAVPFAGPLACARVDLVPGPDGPLLLELELTEPSLFLALSPGAADRAAGVLAQAL